VTGYEVDTGYLHGYARQLEGSQTAGFATLAEYTATHGCNYDRLSGVLEPAKWIAGYCASTYVDNVFLGCSNWIGWHAEGLTKVAINYDTAEETARQNLLATGMGQGGGAGVEPASGGGGTPAGFGDGVVLDLGPPEDPHLTADVEERIQDYLGPVAEVVQEFTGYDIIAEWLPIVLGDWGALRRQGQTWHEIEYGLNEVYNNLDGGLDALMAHWRGGDEIGASAEFEKSLRGKVLFGMVAFRDVAGVFAEAFQFFAASYEELVNNALWLLDFYGLRFKAVVKRVSQAIKDVTPNPLTWAGLIEELVSLVMDYVDFVKHTIESVGLFFERLSQMVDLAVAEVKAAMSLFVAEMHN
jgi:hypothetical protein